MGKKFRGELHALCEEARWSELRSLLNGLLEAEDADGDADDGGGENNFNFKNSEGGEGFIGDGRRRPNRTFTATTAPSSSGDADPAARDAPDDVEESASSCGDYSVEEMGEGTVLVGLEGGGLMHEEEAMLRTSYGESGIAARALEDLEGIDGEPFRREDYAFARQDSAYRRGSGVVSVNSRSISTADRRPYDGDDNGRGDDGARMSPERMAYLRRQLLSREGPNKWTPLMVACVRAPPPIISLLVRACPEACSIPDRSGSLPLHLVCCWRRSKTFEASAGAGGGRDELVGREIAGAARRGRRRGSTGDGPPGDVFEKQKRELCLVIHVLMTAFPDSLATVNRWRQTPLHSLFESKSSGRAGGAVDQACLVETVLGTWRDGDNGGGAGRCSGNDDNGGIDLRGLFDSYDQSNPSEADDRLNAAKIGNAVRSAVRRALRARDSKGRLPLHRAAECPWADEAALRLMVDAFPAAAYAPVVPPPREGRSGRGGSVGGRSRGGASAGGSSTRSWDPNEDAVIPEGEDDGGPFPRTGGCRGRDLAVHLLHRRFLSPLHSGPRAPPSLLSLGGDSLYDEGEMWSHSHDGTDVSVFLNENHCGAISALLEPLVTATGGRLDNFEARMACAATGASSGEELPPERPSVHSPFSSASETFAGILPLHIAALHGVSYRIMEGLCRAHPDGAATQMNTPIHRDRLRTLPIELFEEGRAGREVNAASDVDFPRLSFEYFRRSDLLFSCHPEAVSSKGVVYSRDAARLARFEELIRREARATVLSDVAGSVWLFLCRGVVDPSQPPSGGKGRRRPPNFGASVGRILAGQDPRLVSRLDFLRTTSIPEGVRVPPLANGRTILEESRHRMPAGSMKTTMWECFFHCSVLEFLEARDALAYSSTCRKAWTRGVRLLQRMSNNGRNANNHNNSINNNKGRKQKGEMDAHGTWDISKQSEGFTSSESSSMLEERDGKVSQPWQKLELPCVPGCTHTAFVSCDVAYRSWDEDDDGGSAAPANGGSAPPCEGGGLLVLSDGRRARLPHLVVASSPVRACDDDSRERNGERGDPRRGRQRPQRRPATRVRFAFNHERGRSYTLWYYGSERHTLSVSDLVVRQLVYACDYNGHNPLHVLLCEGDSPPNLREQFDALLRAGFGADLPVHYALKVGAPERTLRCLIEANPASLLDTDAERRTPLHAAFACSRTLPKLGVARALLTGPGANATHLKDSSGRLPIHVAAERGAEVAILGDLAGAYADGCYRRTDNGDLPLHLLVRSGSATRAAVELLLRPIVHNPTICAYPGSSGVHLPLHIAAEYRCGYKILEGLLSSHPEAARTHRQLLKPADASEGGGQGRPKKDSPKYALEIFEEGRGAAMSTPKQVGNPSTAVGEADFNLRSDLIFVHNPNVPKSVRPYITIYYRDEKDRIERLSAVIKREAMQCSNRIRKRRRSVQEGDDDDKGAGNKLGDMARLAWCWMCTDDRYAGVVSDVVSSLPVEAARFLASIENPNSEPVKNLPVKDCSAPRCALVLESRLAFLGRYVVDFDGPPLHESESCAILRARDVGAKESHLSIRTLLDAAEPDIDDYSHACGSVYAITGNSIEVDRFTHFASKIGVSQSDALSQIEALLGAADGPNLRVSGVRKSAFLDFCGLHDVDDEGCRDVAIKFMRHRGAFELERQCRDILSAGGSPAAASGVVPVLHQFSLGKDGLGNYLPETYGDGRPSSSRRATGLAGFRHGIVMPRANGDLRDICHREGISSSNLRENARQVGETLRALHEQGITHMNLQLKHVLRFGTKMVLSDFGSALFLKSIKGVNAIGGTSSKICPSILPPEMIARIELSDREGFDRLMRYWKFVHADADYLSALTPHERQAITRFVESRSGAAAGPSKPPDWKEGISSLLETIKFEDLPQVLSKCASFDVFRAVWERMRQNHDLWETTVRPRVDEEKLCAYAIKAHEDRPDGASPPRDASSLPYRLVPPSEGADVWTFGVFLHELCGGGNPFHTGHRGDLRGADAYARLQGWDREAAERSVRDHVQDPLAQDLLCQILVPAEERLRSIGDVLNHPFFHPKSVEAERYLEKHEEMQLLRDNTVTVRKVTKSVTRMLDESMEKYCKLAFATDQIAFPTCLMVLPYGLNVDASINRPILAATPRLLSVAARLGECLLEINRATARLSFWLMMSGRMRGPDGCAFKSQMQDWLKRARYESCASIAAEIVTGLGCGTSYAMVCEEVLACDGNISKAKSYMRDPIRAARRAFKQYGDKIAELYKSFARIYLVDEMTLLPKCVPRNGEGGTPYPLHLDPNPRIITKVLLPFMNIVVMKALARNRFEGLASLLGIPPSVGIPDSWRQTESGLLHSAGDSTTIEDFVCLQKILRKDDLHEFLDDASAYSRANMSHLSGVSSAYGDGSILSISGLGLKNVDLSPGDPAVAAVPMAQLELLFRERDPDRDFGRLRRVATGNLRKSTGLWTGVETARQLKGMAEIAEVEEQLREAKASLDKSRDAAAQYSSLLSRRQMLRKNMPRNVMPLLAEKDPDFDRTVEELPVVNARANDQGGEDDEYDEYSRSSVVGVEEQQPQDERESDPRSSPPCPEETLQVSNREMAAPRQQPAPLPPPSPKPDDEAEYEAKKKMRKSKRRFRPWFTAC